MAGKAKQTVTTTKTRQKKKPEGSLTCPICGGVGHVPKGYNKKKK
jgi:competence CoiA-like predicted nuclease